MSTRNVKPGEKITESYNEAAERLRSDLMEAYDGPPLAEVLADMEAYEREVRRATVERIREQMDERGWRPDIMYAVLDEEAAR